MASLKTYVCEFEDKNMVSTKHTCTCTNHTQKNNQWKKQWEKKQKSLRILYKDFKKEDKLYVKIDFAKPDPFYHECVFIVQKKSKPEKYYFARERERADHSWIVELPLPVLLYGFLICFFLCFFFCFKKIKSTQKCS